MAQNRKVMYCSDEIDEQIKRYSEALGISESGFMNMCIAQYHMQQEAISSLSKVDDIVARLERLENQKA